MKRLAKDLTEKEQCTFAEEFYNVCSREGLEIDDMDNDNPNPWGCPWCWSPNEELVGMDIGEMAYNFMDKYFNDIKECLKEFENES